MCVGGEKEIRDPGWDGERNLLMEEISAFFLFLGGPSGHSLLLILRISYAGILSFPSLSFSPIAKLCLAPDVLEKLQYFLVF